MVFVFRWRPEPALLSAPVQYEGALATLAQGASILVPPRGNLTVLVQREGIPAREQVPPVPA